MSEDRLQGWEDDADNSAPTVKQLRTIATAYVRPLGVFYLSAPPEEEELIPDFRRLPDFEEGELSPALRLEIRLAHERRQEAIDLVAATGQRMPTLGVRGTLQHEPEALAARLRDRLGLSIAQQQRWRNDGEAFNGWRAALEACGVLVFQTGGAPRFVVDTKEARGFSIADHPLPVAVANGREAPVARIFTLLHELVHVVLRHGGLCDLHEAVRPTRHVDRVEVFCNRVAGAVLVPREALERQELVLRHRRGAEWDDEDLSKLARRFWVSPEVALRRLVLTGRASREFYQVWREERQARQTAPAERGGFLRPSDRVLKRDGHLFPRLVLTAYRDRRIPISDVIELLDVGPRHFERVEQRAFEGA